jgi:hypothetical protein
MSGVTLLAAQAVPAQLLVRVGLEFQVNAYTTGNQSAPAAASNGPGFVLVWSSSRDGSSQGIFGQRFSSGGTGGGEFQINTYTEGDQNNPRVAADSVGNFVVIWQSTGQDGDNAGIFGHRFDSTGAPLGGEFQVNSFTVGYQGAMHVAAGADGNFVVVWSSYAQDDFFSGSFGRRFSSTGVPQATEFQVNASTTSSEYAGAVGVQSDGHFVVTWASAVVGGGGLELFARRFDSAGTPQGVFQVNSHTSSSQYDSRIAIAADGDFVIAWVSPEQDGDFNGVFGQRFASGGNAVGGEFQINRQTDGSQYDPAIAVGADGDFVAVWRGDGDGSGNAVLARRIDLSGVLQGGDLLVNTYAPGHQIQPEVAAIGSAEFVVTWRSQNQDGDYNGVFAQRLAVLPLATLDVDGNGVNEPLTDGLLVLRARFGFSGFALTLGAVGANCTRCDSATILSYLNGLGLTLDIDDDAALQPLTDGLLILRFLFGFTGTTLTGGAVDPDCGRCDAATIVPYLQTLD